MESPRAPAQASSPSILLSPFLWPTALLLSAFCFQLKPRPASHFAKNLVRLRVGFYLHVFFLFLLNFVCFFLFLALLGLLGCTGFSLAEASGAPPFTVRTQAPRCRSFSAGSAGCPGRAGSSSRARGRSAGSVAVACRLPFHASVWDLPGPGIQPRSCALAG